MKRFKEDGYIYDANDKKIGKALGRFCYGISEEGLFWEPCLLEIERIEKLYYRLTNKLQSLRNEQAAICNKIASWMLRDGISSFRLYAKPMHAHQKKDDDIYWEYRFSTDDNKRDLHPHFEWVKKPAINNHPELGQRYYHLDRYAGRDLYFRANRIERMLLRAIYNNICAANNGKLPYATFNYVINGRSYFLEEELIDHRGYYERKEALKFTRRAKMIKVVLGAPDWMEALSGKVLSIEEMQRMYKEKEGAQ